MAGFTLERLPNESCGRYTWPQVMAGGFRCSPRLSSRAPIARRARLIATAHLNGFSRRLGLPRCSRASTITRSLTYPHCCHRWAAETEPRNLASIVSTPSLALKITLDISSLRWRAGLRCHSRSASTVCTDNPGREGWANNHTSFALADEPNWWMARSTLARHVSSTCSIYDFGDGWSTRSRSYASLIWCLPSHTLV